jgi:predicted Zn-dependent protease
MAADGLNDADLLKAYGLLQNGDYIGANRLLKPLIRQQSSNVVARRYFSYVLLQQGKLKEAADQIRAMSKLGANSSFDYWLYAQSYVGAGQKSTGQLCLTRAFSVFNSPSMSSFLRKYSADLEKDPQLKPTPKIDYGNDQKRFPPTPFAAKAGA